MNTGPKNTRVGLVFSLDVSSPRSFSATGNTTYNGFPQMLKNMVAPTDVITAENGMYIGGPQYYTAFAIDYPESSYGGSAASRQGLTAGLNVVSGGKTYDSSRALHMWVWNNDTNGWIADSFFRGFRLSGHCYDNYTNAENGYGNEITLFIQDYNTIKATFPNCTFIITGSHRADRYTAALREILENLGMPKGYIESDYIAAPEWILVGKPNLGHGKAFGWSYENYSTDASRVAHLVFHLPVFGGNNNILSFDGTNDYINLPKNYQSGFTSATYIFVCKPTVLPSATYHQLYIQESSTWIALYNYAGVTFFGIDLNNGSGWFDNNGGYNTGARTTATISANTYYHIAYSWDGSNVRIYLNGVLESTTSTLQAANGRQNVTTLGAGTTSRNIGSRYNGTGNNWVGEINAVLFYDKALSQSEILENLDGYRNRFKIN